VLYEVKPPCSLLARPISSPVSVMNRLSAYRICPDRFSSVAKKSLFSKLSATPRMPGSVSVSRSTCRDQMGSALSRSFTSLNEATPFSLCFLRHGQSTWNRDNRFIGWTDTPLTDQGVLEARVAGQMLRNSSIQFDEVHTSLLRRCIRTTNIVLMELAQEYIPLYKSWRLNERNYGDLVSLHKKQCVAEFGAAQVKRWRRSYDEPPPPMRDDHPYHPANDPRYRNVRLRML
jgi:Histidine phosphatase superfamily (branch 1)